ncbi:hypothetical protein FACS1894208_02330 [Clostridia bacterium]|nr:hypothetical protein FACS1894208_02330 [Clostridia bacterium]
MEYSKIKKVRAVNFRSIGSVEIDFSDCPIVALTGTNESGKSSFIRAFGAVAGNLWRAKQNQYIRTGQSGFAVVLELEDGTKVQRKKTSDVNGYTLVLPDGTRRDATKIATDVPDYIDAVMGLFRDPETGESLQVRTYDDPLLFVGTTDGQNYKSLHNAINNLDVREASVAAKSDVARLAIEAEKKRNEVEVYTHQLADLPLIDTEYVRVLLSAAERALPVSVKFDSAMEARKVCDELDPDGALAILSRCKPVNADVMRLYDDAVRHREVAAKIDTDAFNILAQCKMVNVIAVRLFAEAARHREKAQTVTGVVPDDVGNVAAAAFSLFERGKALQPFVAVKEVPVQAASISERGLALFEAGRKAAADAAEAGANYDKLSAAIAKVTEMLKESGMRVVSCDKCGNTLVVS